MKKPLLAVLAIGAVIAIGAVVLLRNDTDGEKQSSVDTVTSTSEQPIETEATTPAANEPVTRIGSATAPVKIIEFIDYKCPNCNRFHREVGKELKTNFIDTNTAYLEIKQLPFIGPDSERAALGAYCAAEQNLFEQYNTAVFDYLWERYYKNNDYSTEFEDILTTSLLADLLEGTSVQRDNFTDCIDTKKFQTKVDADKAEATARGVRGTPSFVIGERVLSNVQPLSVFKTLIELEQR